MIGAMIQITHRFIDGQHIQIVTPRKLKEILDDNGESYEKPEHFLESDEWEVAE